MRAIYAFLIAFAALWAMPTSGRADVLLYVINNPEVPAGPEVREYRLDFHVSKLINAKFITGLSRPRDLALLDNTLFVANFGSDTVGAYNATTGDVIKASFITGLSRPVGLAVSDQDNELFVSNIKFGTVGKYDAKTGAAINASLIIGLTEPTALAVSQKTPLFPKWLFVANIPSGIASGTVGKYHASTGAVINPGFITGLSEPRGLAVFDNTLFVAESGNNRVGKYSVVTGAALDPDFIRLPRPVALAVLGDSLFVMNRVGTVSVYNAKNGINLVNYFFLNLGHPLGFAVKGEIK